MRKRHMTLRNRKRHSSPPDDVLSAFGISRKASIVWVCDGCERQFKVDVTRPFNVYRIEYNLCPRCYREMQVLSESNMEALRRAEDAVLEPWNYIANKSFNNKE